MDRTRDVVFMAEVQDVATYVWHHKHRQQITEQAEQLLARLESRHV